MPTRFLKEIHLAREGAPPICFSSFAVRVYMWNCKERSGYAILLRHLL